MRDHPQELRPCCRLRLIELQFPFVALRTRSLTHDRPCTGSLVAPGNMANSIDVFVLRELGAPRGARRGVELDEGTDVDDCFVKRVHPASHSAEIDRERQPRLEGIRHYI